MDAGAKLVHMANQIAAFFRSYPAPEAVAGVHDHLVAFWTPGMRGALAARAGASPDGLDPLVVEALHHLRGGTSPAGREAAGPAEVGALGASDAG